MNVTNELATFYLKKYAKMLSLFAKQICNKCPDAEYEEIRQILSIKLISIIKTYKDGPCKESSYFYKIFEREARSIVRSYYSIKNVPFVNQLDIQTLLKETDNPEQMSIENISLADSNNEYLNPNNYVNEKNLIELIEKFIDDLNGIDKDIFVLFFNGMGANEISKKLKIERKLVYVKIKKMKKNLAERIKLID